MNENDRKLNQILRNSRVQAPQNPMVPQIPFLKFPHDRGYIHIRLDQIAAVSSVMNDKDEPSIYYVITLTNGHTIETNNLPPEMEGFKK